MEELKDGPGVVEHGWRQHLDVAHFKEQYGAAWEPEYFKAYNSTRASRAAQAKRAEIPVHWSRRHGSEEELLQERRVDRIVQEVERSREEVRQVPSYDPRHPAGNLVEPSRGAVDSGMMASFQQQQQSSTWMAHESPWSGTDRAEEEAEEEQRHGVGATQLCSLSIVLLSY